MIGGSSDVDQESMGAFQEFPQVQNDINFLSVTVVGRMTNIIIVRFSGALIHGSNCMHACRKFKNAEEVQKLLEAESRSTQLD